MKANYRTQLFQGVTRQLFELCLEITDCHHSTPKWTQTGKIVIRNFNIKNGFLELSNASYTDKETFQERIRRSVPLPGDLIITREAPMGEVCIIPEGIECCLGQRMVLIKPDHSKVTSEFLLFALQSEFVQKQIQKSDKTGSIVSNLRIPVLKELEIPVFGEIQTKRIGEVLYNLNQKISLNNRINAELEAMAKLIYDYWFVQFDFPYDFAQGKPADETSNSKDIKPYKAGGGKMVYNEELKREIPEGWEVGPIADWIGNDKSGDWGKEEEEGNYLTKVSCIRGADINGLNGKGEVKAPTRFILEKNEHKILNSGDLIIEISGGSPTQSTGRMAFITNETLERFDYPLICSNFCKAVTLKEENSLFNFAFEWNRLYDAGVFFGWEGKTSGIKNFLFESFVTKNYTQKPPTDLMQQFTLKVKPMHSMIQQNLKQNQELASLRDWLLPMLMNGQVKVKAGKSYSIEEGELGMVAEG